MDPVVFTLSGAAVLAVTGLLLGYFLDLRDKRRERRQSQSK